MWFFFSTWLNNDAITRRVKARVYSSSLLWPVPDLQIWNRLKKNGMTPQAHCCNSHRETQKFTESLICTQLVFSKTLLKQLLIPWWRLVYSQPSWLILFFQYELACLKSEKTALDLNVFYSMLMLIFLITACMMKGSKKNVNLTEMKSKIISMQYFSKSWYCKLHSYYFRSMGSN